MTAMIASLLELVPPKTRDLATEVIGHIANRSTLVGRTVQQHAQAFVAAD